MQNRNKEHNISLKVVLWVKIKKKKKGTSQLHDNKDVIFLSQPLQSVFSLEIFVTAYLVMGFFMRVLCSTGWCCGYVLIMGLFVGCAVCA